MVTVTVLALADIAWRLNDYHAELVTPIGIVILSAVIALLVLVGATFGGSLVYEYGFNVETAAITPPTTSRRPTSSPASPATRRSRRDPRPAVQLARVNHKYGFDTETIRSPSR